MIPYLRGRKWLLAYLAAAVAWGLTALASGFGGMDTLVAAATLAVFSVVVGLGQMFVIGAGNGNVDLSIPSTMTMAAYLSVGIAAQTVGGAIEAVGFGIACGAAVGLLNAVTILALRIPPMVGTLAVGYVLQSAALAYSHATTDVPNAVLVTTIMSRVGGVPVLVAVAVALAVGATLLLRRTSYGRTVLAIGQNARAAYLAGLPVERTIVATYVVSGVLAGFAGVLLAAFAGGAALDIATSFLLTSIAVVVLGGSSIAGGSVSVAGVWGAALFLTLLQNLLNVAHLPAGWQYISEGLVIVAVLTLFSRPPNWV